MYPTKALRPQVALLRTKMNRYDKDYFSDLPDEMILKIICDQLNDPYSIIKFGFASKRLNNIANDHLFWLQACKNNKKMNHIISLLNLQGDLENSKIDAKILYFCLFNKNFDRLSCLLSEKEISLFFACYERAYLKSFNFHSMPNRKYFLKLEDAKKNVLNKENVKNYISIKLKFKEIDLNKLVNQGYTYLKAPRSILKMSNQK